MAQQNIKAIETIYNGYRFRSRLEARWAVWLDEMGIAYEYEKEGFDLGKSGFYLPDFWLPQQKCWLEIKPLDGWGFSMKCNELAIQSQFRVLKINGEPWLGKYGIELYETNGAVDYNPPFAFGVGRKDDSEIWIVKDESAIVLNGLNNGDYKYPLISNIKLDRAYLAARRARFEHGEHGR